MNIINGPVWKDGCEHPKTAYVCTFTVWEANRTERKYDLYVFDQPRPQAQEICIRFGDEPNEYISPGDLGPFLSRGEHQPYKAAVECLHVYGKVIWKRDKA